LSFVNPIDAPQTGYYDVGVSSLDVTQSILSSSYAKITANGGCSRQLQDLSQHSCHIRKVLWSRPPRHKGWYISNRKQRRLLPCSREQGASRCPRRRPNSHRRLPSPNTRKRRKGEHFVPIPNQLLQRHRASELPQPQRL
jgi:hypothetical protein